MIKVLAPAQMHPGPNRTLAEFQNYWGESHGPLFANTKNLRRYVQHLTLPEAYDLDPTPTFDGVSMFWYDDLRAGHQRPARVSDDPGRCDWRCAHSVRSRTTRSSSTGLPRLANAPQARVGRG